ncbi:hypothetical protein N2152v2_010379 [Parachlorella kessleri]
MAHAQQGAALQNFNIEMVKCLEELHQSREELECRIKHEEAEQRKIQADLDVLQRRLQQLTTSLAKKVATRVEYDRVIAQTEDALQAIVDSSKTLVSATRKSAADIQKLVGHVG